MKAIKLCEANDAAIEAALKEVNGRAGMMHQAPTFAPCSPLETRRALRTLAIIAAGLVIGAALAII